MSNDEQEPSVVNYLARDDGDIIIVFAFTETGQIPMVIVPASERAKAVFKLWGMKDDVTGIEPPIDAMDFIKLVPRNWIVEQHELKPGAHIVQEITLPRDRIVVH